MNLILEFQQTSAKVLESPLELAKQSLEDALDTHAKSCAVQNEILKNVLNNVRDPGLYSELNSKYEELQRIHMLNRAEISAQLESITKPTRMVGRERVIGDAWDQVLD